MLADSVRRHPATGRPGTPSPGLVRALADGGRWVVPHLSKSLRNGDPELTLAVLRVFEAMGTAATIAAPEIGLQLVAKDGRVRNKALDVIVAMGEMAGPALSLLSRHLRLRGCGPESDLAPDLRFAARLRGVLVELCRHQMYWLVRTMNRCDGRTRRTLLALLRQATYLGKQVGKKPLRLLGSKHAEVRCALLVAMQRARDVAPDEAPALVVALGDAHWSVRAAALDAMPSGIDGVVINAVKKLLEDPDRYVRERARAALVRARS